MFLEVQLFDIPIQRGLFQLPFAEDLICIVIELQQLTYFETRIMKTTTLSFLQTSMYENSSSASIVVTRTAKLLPPPAWLEAFFMFTNGMMLPNDGPNFQSSMFIT